MMVEVDLCERNIVKHCYVLVEAGSTVFYKTVFFFPTSGRVYQI